MVSVCLPSDALLQHLPSYLGFPYLGHGVSLHGCSSKAQPLLLNLDEGYLLTSAPPNLECGVAPLSPLVPAQPLLTFTMVIRGGSGSSLVSVGQPGLGLHNLSPLTYAASLGCCDPRPRGSGEAWSQEHSGGEQAASLPVMELLSYLKRMHLNQF